jgi:hypothetical protein
VISPTAQLRERLRDLRHGIRCEACGQFSHAMSTRSMATEAGVDPSTLWRFLAGKGITSPGFDALTEWAAGR